MVRTRPAPRVTVRADVLALAALACVAGGYWLCFASGRLEVEGDLVGLRIDPVPVASTHSPAPRPTPPALEAPALLDDAGEYDDDLRLLDEFQFGQGLFEADLDEVRAGKGKQAAGTSAALAAPPCFDERVDMDDGSGVFAKATDLGPIAAPLPAGWPVDLAGGI